MGYALYIVSTVNWWLRSPEASGGSAFANVNNNGNSNNNNANNANGVAPGSSLGRQSNRKAAKSVQGGEKERMALLGKR